MTKHIEERYCKYMKQYTEEYGEDCTNITIEEFAAADLIRDCRLCGELLDERKCLEPIYHGFVCPECANIEKEFFQQKKNQDGHLDYDDLCDKCVEP